MFNDLWKFERAKRPNIMRSTIDFNSLRTVKSTTKNTANFELTGEILRHSADHDQFTLAVELKLVPAPSYSIFKQDL